MAPEPVVGEWGNFVFKMVEPQDHPRILQHLRDCLYYPAFYRIGYTKEVDDDEMDMIFQGVLKDGHNLSFYAEDKATGKVAGCRVITMETRGHKEDLGLKTRICKGVLTFYNGIVEDANVCDRYKLDSYPHMFGISVEPEFRQQGLAIEIYRRAIALMKAKNFPVAMVAFVSPYSRAAAMHHGFIELASRFLLEALDEEGNVLYPEADPKDFLNLGVFEIK